MYDFRNQAAQSRGGSAHLRGLRVLCEGLPAAAIEIVRGIAAQVDPAKCVGCGKCARECPASVIVIQEVAV